MEALAIRTEVLSAPGVQEVTAAMFNDFIAFIDRSERTEKNYCCNLRQFMAWLRYKAITRPERRDIISYRDWLASDHKAIRYIPTGWEYRTKNGQQITERCKPSTIRLYLQSVKQFFKWAAASGLYPDITQNIHAPKATDSHKRDSLTAEEVLTIENSITSQNAIKEAAAAASKKDTAGRIDRATEQGKRLYAMYLLAVNAGLRTVELSRASVKDFETKGGQSWLWIWGKGHSSADKRKPIAAEVAEAIKDYLNARSDSYTGSSPLFVSTGNRSGGKQIAATTISTMIKQAMKAAGYNSERLTAHSLRHTAAANVMQITGNNIYKTQQYLRHSSPKTTEIYLENDTAAQDSAIASQLYKRYHGEDQTGSKDQLYSLLAGMTDAQIMQLTGVAEAIAR